MIALLVVGGIILLGGLVAGFVAYRFVSSPDGQKVVAAVTSGAAVVAEASNAPGTKELRGIGCDTAMVMDNKRIQAIANTFGDGGVVLANAPLDILCQPTRGGASPTCDQVAATYLAAMGGRAAATFKVTVAKNGGTAACTETYSEEGKQLGGGRERR